MAYNAYVREEPLLQHIYVHAGDPTAAVTIPPGDDMGALRWGDETVLVAVDQLGDALHVQLETTPLEKIARKAMTRNLSDVAAMAARPRGAVVAAALPRDLGDTRATDLFDALRHAGEAFGCPLVGGDIAIWKAPLMLSVTVLAEPAGIEPVLRSNARIGDAIYVTGSLGGSLETVGGYTHHLDFEPRIELARLLAENPRTRPHCMIDLSDGLGRDLARICRASRVSALVDARILPISQAAHQAAQRSDQPPWYHAISDGEDYELLFTAPPEVIPTALAGVHITRIGTIQRPRGEHGYEARLRLPDDALVDMGELGWEHHT